MPPTTSIKSYTDYALRRGDKDKAKRWSGVKQASSGGTPVEDLQNALQAVGVLDAKPDGDYGPNTETAVRRFQWNARNLKYWLVNGTLQFNPPNFLIPVTGVADAATTQELKKWVAAGAVATGNLVRVDLASYPQLIDETNSIANANLADGEILVDADFIGSLQLLNGAAEGANVKLYITQAFRVAGVPVSGAVVTPATKSQHLIGHAIDCNILDGKTRVNSSAFADGTETDAADAFVQAAKNAGLRWGGDFNPVDYVHFDDFVAPHSDDYLMRYFFNQRTIARQQPILSA